MCENLNDNVYGQGKEQNQVHKIYITRNIKQ